MPTRLAAAAATAPARALSLHLGLNGVDPAAYAGWDGPLAACEFDARDMAALAQGRGIKPTLLLTRKATRSALLAGLRKAAKALQAGDLFFLSYSGHGGQVPDRNKDEPDHKDETWCLYDGQLIDDELYLELSRFASGVRVLVLSDSCHSGSVTRGRTPLPAPAGQRAKLMPEAVARRVYGAHAAFYDRLQADVARDAAALRQVSQASQAGLASQTDNPDAALAALDPLAVSGGAATATALIGPFKPAVLLISGCMDNQVSLDGEHNGAFTEKLLQTWDHGRYPDQPGASYTRFHARIRASMPASQSPNLFALGPAAAFARQAPFSV
ncbi:MAG: caspase family protein [Rubrivivax sp.]|nr:caspase family protein [Rubrivivax sp.]